MSTGPTVQVDKTYATVEIASGGATVTVDVPETTVSITAPGPQGPAGTGADGYILSAYDTTDQIAASTTVAYPIRLNTVDISDGITVANNGSSQPTRITFANDGDYNVQFSIQFVNTSATEANVNVWFRKNEADISHSNSQVTVPKKHGSEDGAIIMALNFIVSAASGDYVEIMWQTESTTVSIEQLPAGTTPTTPATPSVIVTAMVNRYLEVGPAGPGVPTGGTTGQVLTKASATDYDTTWATPTAPGLRLLKTENVGSGVATIVISGAFNSTYNNYRIIFSQIVGSVSFHTQLRLRMGSSTTGHYGGFFGLNPAQSGTFAGASNGTATPFCQVFNAKGSVATIDIASPYLAENTSWAGNWNDADIGGYIWGSHLVATSYTDLTIITASGTVTGGTIRIYGYNQ